MKAATELGAAPSHECPATPDFGDEAFAVGVGEPYGWLVETEVVVAEDVATALFARQQIALPSRMG